MFKYFLSKNKVLNIRFNNTWTISVHTLQDGYFKIIIDDYIC